MALPANCVGNIENTRCTEYTGLDIPELGISNGEPLEDVIVKLGTFVLSLTVASQSDPLNSDNITSRSLIRNPSSVCASAITQKNFTYSLTSSQTGTTFTWDLRSIINNLPDEYDAATIRVKATGAVGANLLGDSNKISAGFNLSVDKYPVVIDINVRVTAPCGNIDLTTRIELINPALTGTYGAVLTASDLNPRSGQLSLTEHLNNLEGQVSNQGVKLNSIKDVDIDGVSFSIPAAIQMLNEKIRTIEESNV